eukprot:6183303-Amphidinium_carterae.1
MAVKLYRRHKGCDAEHSHHHVREYGNLMQSRNSSTVPIGSWGTPLHKMKQCTPIPALLLAKSWKR